MKTPAFWHEQGTLSNILLPLSYLYQWAHRLRCAYTKPAVFPIPVVCIGNLTAGGSGKTPVALHIGRILAERNAGAYFLSRGYGGALAGPVLVDPKKHTAREVGDEPLLLAHVLPTVVAKNRLLGARMCLQKGARLIIMDDGFQNPTIAKSLSILVMDGKIGLGNERIIPAGPLRESPAMAFKRAHAVIILNRSTAIPKLPEHMAVLSAKTHLKNGEMLKGKKLFAFCGLAYPQKFFDALRATGAHIVGTQAFADHHAYSDIDINRLIAHAVIEDAALITTPKDFVRVPPALQECVAVIDVAIDFDDQTMLEGVIHFILSPDAKN